MSDNGKIITLDYLDREAQLYKQAKNNIEENVKIVRKTLEKNTEKEVEAVQKAIKNLNTKIEKIMETEFVKEKTHKIEKSEKQMIESIKRAAETFFKVSKIINDKEELSVEQKHAYKNKLYNKILDKFMTKEEKKIFNQIINTSGIPMIFMGGNSMIEY